MKFQIAMCLTLAALVIVVCLSSSATADNIEKKPLQEIKELLTNPIRNLGEIQVRLQGILRILESFFPERTLNFLGKHGLGSKKKVEDKKV